ncbi:MAG: delta-lactam-biosynthetic de-N-acetylase [Clostridium sp.]
MLICLLNVGAFALNTVSDTQEINWYFLHRKNGEPCEVPKESASFLKDLGGYYVGDTSKKVLYLTFDEGYEKGYTPAILDTLKKVDVKAAFFVVKPYIMEKPELVKRMVEEGHLVCNHSSHHPSMASISDKNKFISEFTEVEVAFKELTGRDIPKYFRPPMGKYSKTSLERTKELGYKSIFWSFAYKDWIVDNQPSQAEGIKKIKDGVFPGCILLLHAVSDTNTKILEKVLTDLKNDGWEFKTLDELPS